MCVYVYVCVHVCMCVYVYVCVVYVYVCVHVCVRMYMCVCMYILCLQNVQYTPKKSSHSVYVELALYVSTVTVFTPFKNRFLEAYRSTNSHF